MVSSADFFESIIIIIIVQLSEKQSVNEEMTDLINKLNQEKL
jgi:hypothetical protein